MHNHRACCALVLVVVLLVQMGPRCGASPHRELPVEQRRQQRQQQRQLLSQQEGTLRRIAKDARAADWEWFLSKSLHLDLAHWRGRQLSMFRDFEAMRAAKNSSNVFGGGDTVKLVLIHNNRWLLPDNKGDITVCEEPCYFIGKAAHAHMSKALQHMPVPDTVFFYNSGDSSLCCGDPDPCSVPMLSHIKTWTDKEKETDILVPQLRYMPNELYECPWEKKEPIAFFRGTPFCGGDGCWRAYLAQRAQQANSTDVHIGLAMEHGGQHHGGPTQQANVYDQMGIRRYPRLPIKDHSRFRWLVSMDGTSASSRFGQLLHINSVVLKQRSRRIEYFYRALEPGRHHLEFFTRGKEDDIFELVPQLNQQYEANSSVFHAMATRSQEFASMFLSPRARFLYWHAALLAYRSLLPDMDQYVAAMVAQLREQGKLQG